MWIWNWLDGGSENQKKANDMPPKEEQQELKELFEDAVGGEFTYYAYHPVYQMARRLFHYAVFDFIGPSEGDDAEKLIEDWEEYRNGILKSETKSQVSECAENSEVEEDTTD